MQVLLEILRGRPCTSATCPTSNFLSALPWGSCGNAQERGFVAGSLRIHRSSRPIWQIYGFCYRCVDPRRAYGLASMQPRLPAKVVHAALRRIIESATFQAAPQLRAFLQFVVETALDGHASAIKAYTIAVEALGRPESFDPTSDAIVRVEAGRLRVGLARYYDGAGADDPVIIEVPRGNYVPEFRWREDVTGHAPPSAGQASAHSVTAESDFPAREFTELLEACYRNLKDILVNLAELKAEIAAFNSPARSANRSVDDGSDRQDLDYLFKRAAALSKIMATEIARIAQFVERRGHERAGGGDHDAWSELRHPDHGAQPQSRHPQDGATPSGQDQ